MKSNFLLTTSSLFLPIEGFDPDSGLNVPLPLTLKLHESYCPFSQLLIQKWHFLSSSQCSSGQYASNLKIFDIGFKML